MLLCPKADLMIKMTLKVGLTLFLKKYFIIPVYNTTLYA